MQRHFDEELRQLKDDILRMGALAQESIVNSVDALKNRDKAAARKVIDSDVEMDRLELVIDDKCLELIALHQPMARDLRFITTAIKLNAELERIGDLAVDVAQRALDISDKPLLKPLVDIPRLAEIAKRMTADAIESFIKSDTELAKKVVLSDSEADTLKRGVEKELIHDYMMKDGSTSDRAVPLLLAARHLERVCDHAVSMAEDIIYMVSAVVVRHHPEELK
ncbi:MAG: phosphate transport system regulatory protein PhoU [Elusimicrobia bacterium GWA2_56_46]|nr:MAG: phosphate transport system regulatory protein PhoU [Elusimicrobia bacterium GWA2_56_46]OGR55567.1 MAG: phosphate transport system regulatory protein PhoU [Elusimicrobia bacterium GWC2_56_31]HBB67450.1 phosphate transport system regulatory protein PhoU [Elusimicrobiota bacterium]HBW22028.1 phosphate transport system regulatory protein PhoU [Elusimicrobiota bacterium]